MLWNVAVIGNLMEERLARMKFKQRPTVRAKGLAIAVDVGGESYASAIQTRCRQRGLLITTDGSNLVFFPALTIDKATAGEGLDILARCL